MKFDWEQVDWEQASKEAHKAGLTINEAASAIALVSDVPFETAKQNLKSVLNAFSQPSAEAAKKLSEMIGK
jgi:hypothetical protein